MDKIIESFLSEFSTNHSLQNEEVSVQFEHFSNYCVLLNENGINDYDITLMKTGDSTQGIDGIAIEVNGRFVENLDEVSQLLSINHKLDVSFIFVQSKTSTSFNNEEILNFMSFVLTFFSEDARRIFTTPEMNKFLDIKDYIYENAKYLTVKNPQVKLYYFALGDWNEKDINLKAVIGQQSAQLEGTRLFSSISFTGCGISEILKMYRKSKEKLQATINFENRLVMFQDSIDEYGLSGIIPFSEFVKIIATDKGTLRNVFEDNIRDFLGPNNDVNTDIEESIRSKRKSIFCMLNNGVTIIAQSLIGPTGNKVTICDYQIVNGCQTSHILYLNRNVRGIDDLLIPIRIIVTSDEDLKSSITKATNNQTGIKREQLEALSTFQKRLEEYYQTYNEEEQRLYYERRVGQYRDKQITWRKIVTIRSQIKDFASMFCDKPHDAAGHYSLLLQDVGTRIFSVNDKEILYYTCALAMYRFESLVKSKQIPSIYSKSKYHVLMLLKYLIIKRIPKQMNSKKMIVACESILQTLNDPDLCLRCFQKIIKYIDSIPEIDMQDRKVFEKKETTDIVLAHRQQL